MDPDNSFYSKNYLANMVDNNEGFDIKESRTYKFKDLDLKKFGDADLIAQVWVISFSVLPT